MPPNTVAIAPLRFIEFQHPTLVEKPPEGDAWIHEIKYDGYRTELVIQNGKVQFFSRRGFDWTGKYPTISAAAAKLPVKTAIVDGEVIVMNERGLCEFGQLRSVMRWQPERLVFIAFDLMHLDGLDLRSRPVIERRAALGRLLGDGWSGAIRFGQHIQGHGGEFYERVDRLGLEGIVSKRASAPYRSGRTESWLKIKCYEESTYEVAGVLREPGRPAIAYMVTPDKDRRYVGGAVIKLGQEMRERLWKRVQAKAKPVKGVEAKPGTEWLRPGMLGRVRHLKGEEKLRHATLREVEEP